jgi:hypothetical protein
MLAAVALFADYAGTVDLSNRTEVRGRHTENVDPDKSLDVVDVPTARIGLHDRRWDHGLGYSAVLVAPDAQAGLSPQLLQFGDVSTSWHDRRVRLTLSETGSYGESNPGYLLGGPPLPTAPVALPGPAGPGGVPVTGGAPVAAVVPPATIRTMSSRTGLASQVQLSRRWQATSLVEYQMGGGVDEASRATLPFVHGPRAEASATYAATRLDGVESRLSLQHGFTSTGPCSPILTNIPLGTICAPQTSSAVLTEGWRRRLGHSDTIALGAGASYGTVRLLAGDRPYTRLYPAFRASFDHSAPAPQAAAPDSHQAPRATSALHVEASVTPVVDQRTGVLDERGQASAGLTIPIDGLTLTGTFSGARSITSPFIEPVTILTGVLDAGYHVSRVLELGTGVRYIWQIQSGFPTIAGGAAFVAATLHAPQIRF